MKRDVLILCQYFYPEYISSATLPTEMAEDMVASGLTVDVLCGYPLEYSKAKNLPKKERYKQINIKRIKYIQLDKKKTLNRLINYFSFIVSMFLKWPSMLKYKSIIVYSNPPLLPIIPALLSVIFRRKFIFVAYDIYPDLAVLMDTIKKGSLIHKMMKITNRIVYKNAEHIVALGEEMKSYMLENKLTLYEEKIKVIPNWYDGTKLNFQKGIRVKENRKFRVLYSGNMGTCQDMDTILNCIYTMRNNHNVEFVLTGHGNKVKGIISFIKEKNLENVELHGFLLGEEYINMLTSADCYLVSLERGVEGMSVPSKTYGYLAAGRPLLAIMSSTTDISMKIIDNAAGFSFEQGEVDKLAQAIEYLCNNTDICDEMGANAFKVFKENYERQISTNKYIDLIKTSVI
ncbi:glycosyltransferase family 4 protein [Paenibacillus sp. FSL H8-0332]|uniref:glycosyltransferase family 4 protein n=1 Tax=Paenibacillus sp. FSL H8-0332 TaxID=2954742 RepID=UPI0030D11B98